MTDAEILKIAAECGDDLDHTLDSDKVFLVAFASAVAAAEREACAKACDQAATYPSSLWEEAGCWNHAAECCASAIRARGNA